MELDEGQENGVTFASKLKIHNIAKADGTGQLTTDTQTGFRPLFFIFHISRVFSPPHPKTHKCMQISQEPEDQAVQVSSKSIWEGVDPKLCSQYLEINHDGQHLRFPIFTDIPYIYSGRPWRVRVHEVMKNRTQVND